MHELEEFLPVQAAGSGGTSGDFLFVQASVRQQRLFARALELRLGEYLETYDDERDSAIIEAYRAGDLEQVCATLAAVSNQIKSTQASLPKKPAVYVFLADSKIRHQVLQTTASAHPCV